MVLVCPRVTWAAASVLVMVRTNDITDPTPYELRLRSELASEGIDAIVANPVEVGGDLRQMAAKFGANAVVEVVVSAHELSTSIWAGDANLAIEVTRQLRISNLQRDAVAVFALSTVDFLRGARLELEQQRRAKMAGAVSNPPPTPTPTGQPPPITPPQPKPAEQKSALAIAPSTNHRPKAKAPPHRDAHPSTNKQFAGVSDRFRIELGYALLLTSARFSWSTAPTLALSYSFRSGWRIGVAGGGPFVNHISTISGRYRIAVDQELFQFELGRQVALNPQLDLEPYLGLGLSRYAADGRKSEAPLVGNLASAWSVYTVLGAKLVWYFGAHLHLVGDVAGFSRWQAPKVEVADIGNMTGNSRWNLLAKLGFGYAF